MRFQVPQFIEVEDKIFGPLTLKQFIYIAGGCGLAFVFFRFLPFILAVIPMAASVLLGCALAFYKVNGIHFIDVVEAGFKYFVSNKLYIWKRDEKQQKNASPAQNVTTKTDAVTAQTLPAGKLKNLSIDLDIRKERLNS